MNFELFVALRRITGCELTERGGGGPFNRSSFKHRWAEVGIHLSMLLSTWIGVNASGSWSMT